MLVDDWVERGTQGAQSSYSAGVSASRPEAVVLSSANPRENWVATSAHARVRIEALLQWGALMLRSLAAFDDHPRQVRDRAFKPVDGHHGPREPSPQVVADPTPVAVGRPIESAKDEDIPE